MSDVIIDILELPVRHPNSICWCWDNKAWMNLIVLIVGCNLIFNSRTSSAESTCEERRDVRLKPGIIMHTGSDQMRSCMVQLGALLEAGAE